MTGMALRLIPMVLVILELCIYLLSLRISCISSRSRGVQLKSKSSNMLGGTLSNWRFKFKGPTMPIKKVNCAKKTKEVKKL